MVFKREEEIELVFRVLTVVSCVTLKIGFFRIVFQFFGIALTRP